MVQQDSNRLAMIKLLIVGVLQAIKDPGFASSLEPRELGCIVEALDKVADH
jgi:hypothetical protein